MQTSKRIILFVAIAMCGCSQKSEYSVDNRSAGEDIKWKAPSVAKESNGVRVADAGSAESVAVADSKADAEDTFATAMGLAKEQDKRLLVHIGGLG